MDTNFIKGKNITSGNPVLYYSFFAGDIQSNIDYDQGINFISTNSETVSESRDSLYFFANVLVYPGPEITGLKTNIYIF